MRVQVWVGDHCEKLLSWTNPENRLDFSRVSDVLLEDAPSTLSASSEEKAPYMEQLMHFHVRSARRWRAQLLFNLILGNRAKRRARQTFLRISFLLR